MANRRRLVLVVSIVVLQVLAAAFYPPFDDELYYWSWSQKLQWSYYDHPLMVALLIRLSSACLGNTLLGVRFLACVASWLTVYCIARLGRYHATVGCLFLTPLFLFGALLMTPDAPLLAFWAGYLFWTVQQLRGLHRDASPTRLGWGWVFGGLLLGLGVLSKYTMAVAVPCGLLTWLGEYRQWRRWLGGYVVHGLVACAVAAPILLYNWQTDFAPLRFQWQHVHVPDGFSLRRLLELYAVQVALVGALPICAWPWVVRHIRSLWSAPRLRACLCFYLFPTAFFFLQACQHRLQPNWLLVAYVAPWPLLVHLREVVQVPVLQPRWYRLAFVLPGICCLLLVIHFLAPISWIDVRKDRLSRLSGKYAVAEQAGEYLRTLDEPPVILACNYQWTSYLRFQGVPALQLPGVSRESFFTLSQPAITGNSAVVFLEGPVNEVLQQRWPHYRVLREFPLLVRGQEVTRYRLVRCWSEL